MSTFVGIDPGITGAIVIVNWPNVRFFDCPTVLLCSGRKQKRDYDVRAMAEILMHQIPNSSNVVVVMEKLHPMPKNGNIASFNLGRGYGIWTGLIGALLIPHHLVSPQRWKKAMLPARKEGEEANKDLARTEAIKAFPKWAANLTLKKHHGRADAMWLAMYGAKFVGKCPI